jgi:hypothetical protein
VEEAVLEIAWWDVSAQAVMVIILVFAFGLLAYQLCKEWFGKE